MYPGAILAYRDIGRCSDGENQHIENVNASISKGVSYNIAWLFSTTEEVRFDSNKYTTLATNNPTNQA